MNSFYNKFSHYHGLIDFLNILLFFQFEYFARGTPATYSILREKKNPLNFNVHKRYDLAITATSKVPNVFYFFP